MECLKSGVWTAVVKKKSRWRHLAPCCCRRRYEYKKNTVRLAAVGSTAVRGTVRFAVKYKNTRTLP